MRELESLKPYLRPHRRLIAAAVGIATLLAVVDVPIPYYIKHIIDDVLRTKPHRHFFGFETKLDKVELLHLIFACLVVNALVKGLLVLWQRVLTERVGQQVIYDLRGDLYRHLQGLDLTFFRESSTGQVMLRFLGDINSVLDLITDGIMRVYMDSVTVVAVVVLLFFMNVPLALLTCAFLPFYVLPFVRWSPRIRDVSHRARDERGKLSGNLQEKIAGIGVVKAFGQEPREEAHFDGLAGKLRDLMVDRARWSGKLNGAAQAAIALCAAVILWVGGLRVMDVGFTRGDLMAFYVLATLLFTPLRRLAKVNDTYQQAVVALQRIREFREGTVGHVERSGEGTLTVTRGDVVFENVTFRYPEDHPVLEDLSFEVAGGQVVALVGPNGAGKTTLVSLLPRFFEANAGRILIDGQDIRNVSLPSLRERIGIVSQDTLLFSGTIAENIAYGKPDATPEEIREAARVANAVEFIEGFRRGFEQRVGERGARLSGGQRQRIAIARAILRDPSLLILDEATSAVDSESETAIQEALNRAMRGRTTFVIAHRVSTVRRADVILVLERGRIVERGTHDELLRGNGAYARICREQLISDEAPDAGGRGQDGLVPFPSVAARLS